MTDYVLDTSIFIAMEDGRQLKSLPPGEVHVSVISFGELSLGLALYGQERLPHRLETLNEMEHSWTPLPVDIGIMRRFASIMAAARRREFRPRIADGLIAATASFHGLAVVTQDRDFLQFDGIEVVLV